MAEQRCKEYLAEVMVAMPESVTAILNERDKEGWEVIAVQFFRAPKSLMEPGQTADLLYCLFRRPWREPEPLVQVKTGEA